MKRAFYNFVNKYAVENLAGYFVVLTGVISAYSLWREPGFAQINAMTVGKGDWLSVLFYIFRVDSSFFGNPWLGLILYLYFFFFLGRMLEEDLGVPKFNLYILVGILQTTLGAIASVYYPLAIDESLFYSSVFLAVAYRYPEYQIYILLVFPIRIKWLGLLSAAILLISRIYSVSVLGSFLPFLGMILGLSNLLLFYGRDFVLDLRGNMRKQVRMTKYEGSSAIHRCTICGITENENRQMDFRYCVECGDHEYCSDHLSNHEHI
ncbi:hypothetical protein CH373_03305 [Leptospira perolatii]|uniref:Rhomboid family intramembrane serine protease n=1 Tax=Leptospira perolatii TaxID=2023191 RepID=A0A2M9ZSJ1_9LEPT|nr:hypothetical protein [Leptospira perolatii]PJZ71526.1 hypothetical protein CH360_03300 [Leptospira perolatii]PJZ75058.1 hypothetical protein CH373_03305 [Leptospira perolatii]